MGKVISHGGAYHGSMGELQRLRNLLREGVERAKVQRVENSRAIDYSDLREL
jgi:hypothetical protein